MGGAGRHRRQRRCGSGGRSTSSARVGLWAVAAALLTGAVLPACQAIDPASRPPRIVGAVDAEPTKDADGAVGAPPTDGGALDVDGAADAVAARDGGALRGLTSCRALSICVSACGTDSRCSYRCAAEGDEAAVAAYQVASQCLQEHCADVAESPQGAAACIRQHCGESYAECFEGDAGCAELLVCMGRCAPGDLACPTACYYGGTVDAQATYREFGGCIFSACGATPEVACSLEAQAGACEPTVLACVGSGDRDCLELDLCLRRCGAWDDACFAACLSRASPTGQRTFRELSTCLIGACGLGNDATCIGPAQAGVCARQYLACVED